MSKKTSLIQVIYNRIPEAINAMGGVAHSEAVKIWILESENATKEDYGRTPSNKKFPNGRWCFDPCFTSAQHKLKKEKLLFSPAYLYLSTSKTAKVENPLSRQKFCEVNGVDSNGTKYEPTPEKPKKPKKTKAKKPSKKVKSEPVVVEEIVSQPVVVESEEIVEPQPDPVEVQEVETQPVEEIISESVVVEADPEPAPVEEEIVSQPIEPEPVEEIISEPVEEKIAKTPTKEDIWDDIFDEEFTYDVKQLPNSKFYACVEGNSYIISLDEKGKEAVKFELDGNVGHIVKPKNKKIYEKLQSRDLRILDNFIAKLSSKLGIDVSIRREIVPNQENPIIFMFSKVGMTPFITEI